MASEIEIETEKSQKLKKKTHPGSNRVLPVMLAFYNTDRKTVKERSTCIYRSNVCINSKEHENVMSCGRNIIGPHGFCGSGENGYLFSGSFEALVIIFRDLGSKFIVFGDLGSPAKK